MKTKNIQIISVIALSLFLISSSILPAQAGLADMSAGSAATGGMSSIMSSLGVDQNELKYSVQTMNVARQKQTPPQVSLTFTPANPQTGDNVSVTATPLYFMNDSSKLYFTWFLMQNGCEKTDRPNAEEKEKCDLTNNGKVDIEDYKLKAMRILANNDFSWEKAIYASSDKKSNYDASFGGDDQKGKNPSCYIQNIRSGDVYTINCDDHLFPNAPHDKTGDNSFGIDEELFWHTDPTSADTAQSGNTDEANVAGLGMNTFTWNYTPGDKIGVVIEGSSIEPSQTKDASYRTMWAAPKGMCYKKNINKDTFKKVSELNDCLYDSLISPSENSPESNKLEVNLSYLPTSPINDTSLKDGDEIVIQSNVSNANDDNYLQYSWEVFTSDEPNPDSWGSPLPKSSLPNATQMEGLGITSFKFKLNIAKPKKYFNVKLTVKENTTGSLFREGHNSVLIPITSNDDTLSAFDTSISNATSPYIVMTNKICDSGVEAAVCPIAKNKIIGLNIDSTSLTDFMWTINGIPFTYQSCFFAGCNLNKQSNVAYFPALKEVGEKYTVALTALNQKTGEKVSLSRIFQVIDPTIEISSADQNTCKPVLLGNYIDISGKAWPDYSKTNFWGLADKQIKLQAHTTGFTAAPTDLIWVVDGIEVTATNAATLGYTIDTTGTLTLPAKAYGESYEVSVVTIYSQDGIAKTALNKYWDVSYDQFYEKSISNTIKIQLQDSTSTVAATQSKKIMATIYGGTPAYLAFLLKIALTAFLILFTSQLTLSFFPKK